MHRKNVSAVVVLALIIVLVSAYLVRDMNSSPSREKARNIYFGPKALILYDEYAPFDDGALHAVALSNLLGHFRIAATIEPAIEYKKGGLDRYGILFYIGYVKNAYIPEALFSDILKTDKTVVWFQHNLNQLQGSAGPDFMNRYGFFYVRTAVLGEKAVRKPPDFFDRFYYKDRVFDRQAITGRLPGLVDLSMVITKVTDPAMANVVATVENPDTKETIPYIIRAKNIWFVADIPFMFLDLRDAYLIFADALHDMVKIDHPRSLKAFVRVEDVTPNTSSDELKTIAYFFRDNGVPFAMAVTPFFKDPAGVTRERALDMSFDDAPDVLAVLKNAQAGGAAIVMHGTTHQRDYFKNPSLRVTSVGYEFWDSESETPVRDDSAEAARQRIEKGKAEFARHGLAIAAFEPPHYTASPADYRVFASEFDRTMQNVTYFLYDTSRVPGARTKRPVKDMISQAFPYVIYRDYYGQFVIPGSTVGNFEYEDINDELLVEEKLDRILNQAEAVTVVRDGCASFYVHPFVIPGMQQHNINGPAVLKKVIDGFRKMGYDLIDIRKAGS